MAINTTLKKMPTGDGNPSVGGAINRPNFPTERGPGKAFENPIEQFRAAIEAAGLVPPDDIHGDGKLHRFASDGRRGDDAGWYVLHLDGVPAGAFGCWRLGVDQKWSSKAWDAMTVEERKAHRRKMQDALQQREADAAQRQQQAAQVAAQRWQAATEATEHPYLRVKGVQAHGVKREGDALLIPMRDAAGALHSLQVIDAEGNKRFLPGGRVKGCYHVIGQPQGVLIVCEGYATGASIYEATGHAVAVAFTAGNLLEVAQALRKEYPALRLILAADDDWKTPGNPGKTKASEAARAVGGWLAVPEFPPGLERPDKGTDFNDLHALAGREAVKAAIDAAQPVGRAFPAHDSDPEEVVLLNAAQVQPKPVDWLWDGWLARGKLHILAGKPGTGKTTLALAFATAVTTAGRWPDGARCLEAGHVAIWSGEDDPADTLAPRLLAADADLSRVHFIHRVADADGLRTFDPATDVPLLVERLKVLRPALLILDPVISAVAADSHKNAEVRRALQPLVDLAATLGCAVLGITHLTKGSAGHDPLERVTGSLAFGALARIVLLAFKREDPPGRLLARAKSNLGPCDGAIGYELEQADAAQGISASRVLWGEVVNGTARELMAQAEEPNTDDKSEVASATRFLADLLADGPVPARQVKMDADGAGYAWATIRRAADALGIERRKVGMREGWIWALPQKAAHDPEEVI